MKMYIPTGISNYRKLRIEGYYTVDKTLMIQEFLERRSAVTLITRPRRFGKTLNMSMMAEFFDITKDSKALFEGLAIMDTEYAKEMNQYPVIFLSFGNVKGDSEELLIGMLLEILHKSYAQYETIFKNTEKDTDIYRRMRATYDALETGGDTVKVVSSIKTLCEFLSVVYDKKPMIFLDEYDTPFIEAHIYKYYDKVHSVLSGILRMTLKDNEYLQYAMLTGIQRVVKESIFSELNNVKVYGVTSIPYSQYFGFTKEETKAILEYYGLAYSDEVKQMYDGYRFGNTDIYATGALMCNPWSIINYAQEGELQEYWVNTSGNKMIKEAMKAVNKTFKKEYESLIEKGSVIASVNLATSFYEEANNASLWGLFVNAGYLTIIETIDNEGLYRIRIPNQEVVKEFKALTAYHLNVETEELRNLYYSLINKDKDKFTCAYETILLANPSFYDLRNENSYQAPWPAVRMLLLGICLYIKNDYEVLSNRETGKGRSDIILKAKRNNLPSYVIEMKYTKEVKKIKSLITKGETQITKTKYDFDLTNEVIHIVIAHCSKDIAVEWIER